MIDFKKYHEENPHIYQAFVKYAYKAKSMGLKNYSAYSIFEIIRWESAIEGNDKYKVNNTYRPDYARKMMNEHPGFDGFFRTRELKAERT